MDDTIAREGLEAGIKAGFDFVRSYSMEPGTDASEERQLGLEHETLSLLDPPFLPAYNLVDRLPAGLSYTVTDGSGTACEVRRFIDGLIESNEISSVSSVSIEAFGAKPDTTSDA